MQRKRHLVCLFSLLLLLGVVPSAVLPSSAQAASIFDNPRVTSSIKLLNASSSCGEGDVSSNWLPLAQAVLREDNNDSYADALSSTYTDPATHYWGVLQQYTGTSGDKEVLFFSFRKSDTEGYYTFGRDQSYNASLYQKYYLAIPFSWANYNSAESYTAFMMKFEENCDVAVTVSPGSIQSIGGTIEDYNQFAFGFNKLMTNHFPDGYTSMENSLFFVNMPFQAPSGYEGVEIPRGVKYVAMGDSYSSGEGNSGFEVGTDEDGVNECHRSQYAYPHWLQQTPGLTLDSMNFVACSGATTEDVLYGDEEEGNWGEGPQVDALSEDTEIVTITMGGNDIGFKAFATECGIDDCDSTTDIYSTTLGRIENELPDKVEDVLDAIASRTDDAHVFVVGYPYVTPGSDLSSLPIQCTYLNSSEGLGEDSLAARDVVRELNEALDAAVTSFDNTHSSSVFTFIDPNASIDGTFDGHDVCQGIDTFFHNITVNDWIGNGYRARILHPNIDGQYEYYSIVSGEVELVE